MNLIIIQKKIDPYSSKISVIELIEDHEQVKMVQLFR